MTQGQQIAAIKAQGRRKSSRSATQRKAEERDEREAAEAARPAPKRRKPRLRNCFAHSGKSSLHEKKATSRPWIVGARKPRA